MTCSFNIHTAVHASAQQQKMDMLKHPHRCAFKTLLHSVLLFHISQHEKKVTPSPTKGNHEGMRSSIGNAHQVSVYVHSAVEAKRRRRATTSATERQREPAATVVRLLRQLQRPGTDGATARFK
uniref:Uncharacterized protein n=1 Tax=Rhipicephalus zambeziensis TaxID=60191 RepID=A0A224YB50_9ACAR